MNMNDNDDGPFTVPLGDVQSPAAEIDPGNSLVEDAPVSLPAPVSGGDQTTADGAIREISETWLKESRELNDVIASADDPIHIFCRGASDKAGGLFFGINPEQAAKALGLVWIGMVYLHFQVNLPTMFYFWFPQVVSVGLLAALSMRRSITDIEIDRYGIKLLKKGQETELWRKHVLWPNLYSIKLEDGSRARSAWKRKLTFDTTYGEIKLTLATIGGSYQWQQFLDGLRRWKPELADSLEENPYEVSGALDNPTFTKLWLDAMSCPPQRQKLNPLAGAATLQDGKYTCVRQLGSGGQGRVYLARDRDRDDDDSLVVLKEFILPLYVNASVRKEALHEFEHEIATLSKLDHPNIVRLLDSFVEDHRAYLVLEYIGGKSLKEMVVQSGKMAPADAVRHGIVMCQILEYLHGQSPPLVHRDFTPDNVIADGDGRAKLIDFTVSRQSAENVTTSVVGKHHYMPPEQFRGKSTPQSDIYALGASLHFLLTGEDPDPLTVSHPRMFNGEVSERLDQIVAKATSLELEDRYASAGELRGDLERWVADSSHA